MQNPISWLQLPTWSHITVSQHTPNCHSAERGANGRAASQRQKGQQGRSATMPRGLGHSARFIAPATEISNSSVPPMPPK